MVISIGIIILNNVRVLIILYYKLLLLLLTTLILLITNSCSITEAPNPGEGLADLYIFAIDLETNEPIVGATIYLDGFLQPIKTPDTLKNVEAGGHAVHIRPQFGYPAQTLELLALPNDFIELPFDYTRKDESPNSHAEITISTNANPAQIILDDVLSTSLSTLQPFLLSPDTEFPFAISVFKAGYKTNIPALQLITTEAGVAQQISFQLELTEIGTQPDYLAPDFKLPNFQLPDVWADTVGLAQFRGKVVLVDFWFSTCQPCRHEFPAFEQLYKERYHEGFRILAVNTGWFPNDENRFSEFREPGSGFELTFPLLKNPDAAVTNLYEVAPQDGAPINILIDRSGVIQYRFGATTYEEMSDLLDEMFN